MTRINDALEEDINKIRPKQAAVLQQQSLVNKLLYLCTFLLFVGDVQSFGKEPVGLRFLENVWVGCDESTAGAVVRHWDLGKDFGRCGCA